ncbi:hypothetical protein VXS29_25570, partial [Escherichia coli]|nr:hypothetical protein [Escherichia coli]
QIVLIFTRRIEHHHLPPFPHQTAGPENDLLFMLRGNSRKSYWVIHRKKHILLTGVITQK